MLTFNNLIIYETILDTSNLKIQSNPTLSQEDKKKIGELTRELDNAEMKMDKQWFHLFKNNLSNSSIETYLKEWKDTRTTLYILRKDNKIIGFCTVKEHGLFYNSIYISFLVISRLERSKGYGKYFFHEIIKILNKDYPGKHLIINVFDKNIVAKKLYLSSGFRPGSLTLVKY